MISPPKPTGTFLDRIFAAKAQELRESERAAPLETLQARAQAQPPARDLAAALKRGRVRLIAECKKASPSKGLLVPDYDPVALARAYEAGGAAAISVLTEAPHFQGSLEHLAAVKAAVGIPVLRKDFLFHPYHIHEARAYGADALLLIVAILEDRQLWELLDLSHELGMQCLVEVHTRPELERALRAGARIIGINNRDLKTFTVDLGTTTTLAPLIPPARVIVSESGIKTRAEIQGLRRCGVDAVLVGESLVTAADIAAKVRELA